MRYTSSLLYNPELNIFRMVISNETKTIEIVKTFKELLKSIRENRAFAFLKAMRLAIKHGNVAVKIY